VKSNLIEITVSGRTGSGKSEVLEVISTALREHYGHRANITGETCAGAVDDAKTTGQTARGRNTVFALFEQNITGDIKIHG
jgi:nucleoside-triphosphatase THEP1